MMFGGALTTGLGVGLALAFKSPLEEANKFAKLQNDILNNGAKLAQLKGITDWANNDKSIRNLSVNEKLHVAGEAFALTRDAGRDDVEHTLKLAPILAKIEAIAKNSGKEMSDAEKADFAKILELGGGFNHGVDTQQMADFYFRLMASGNNTLKPSTIRSILGTDGSHMMNMSQDAIARSEPLMQEMGSKFGTAHRTLMNRLVAHVGMGGAGSKTFDALKQWGVFDKQGKVIDSQTLITDYDLWLRKHMPDFYKAAGAKNDADRQSVNYKMGSATGMQLIQRTLSQGEQMDASGKSVAGQHGLDQSLKDKGGPLDQQFAVLSAKWHDLMLRIGVAVLPMAIKGLSKLTDIMESVAGFAKEHPRLVKIIAVSMALFAVFLVIGGAIALVIGVVTTLAGALGISGGLAWVIGGLTAAIPIVTGLLVGLWDGIKDMWKHRPTWLGGDGAVNEPPKPGVNGATQADQSYYAALHGVSPNVKTAAQSGAAGKSGNVYLDGKKVGSVLDKHLAKGAGNLASSNTFDFSMGQAPAGMAY